MAKKRVYLMSGGFGCSKNIVCETPEQLIDMLTAELDTVPITDIDIGEELTIRVDEMTEDELKNTPEFDGC